jgi:putative transposase
MTMPWLKNLWSLLKIESDYSDNFETINKARAAIFDWINWYNNERIHSSIGYISPVKFEEQLGDLMNRKYHK